MEQPQATIMFGLVKISVFFRNADHLVAEYLPPHRIFEMTELIPARPLPGPAQIVRSCWERISSARAGRAPKGRV